MFEIGNSLREARVRQGLDYPAGRARDEDPREVHPRARGGGVRVLPVGHVHQGLHALVRGVPRSRRPALRRRVQLAPRRRGLRRHAAAPARACSQDRVDRAQGRAARARRHRRGDGARDRRVEVRRRRLAERRRRRPVATPHSRRRPASASSGAGTGTYLEVRRGSATGAVALPGHAARRRLGVPDRQALLALRAAARGRPVELAGKPRHAPGAAQPARRRLRRRRLAG